jgi:hypothetical protein
VIRTRTKSRQGIRRVLKSAATLNGGESGDVFPTIRMPTTFTSVNFYAIASKVLLFTFVKLLFLPPLNMLRRGLKHVFPRLHTARQTSGRFSPSSRARL